MYARNQPVADAEAREIILQWGRLHDRQAGLSAFLPIIAEEGFYMAFGAKRWVGYADFEEHQLVKRKFFDEFHDYVDIAVEPGLPTTWAKTKMKWNYRFRPERSPTSQLIKAYLEHTWEFRRCERTGRPFMQGHVVDLFEYEAGFRPDEPQEYDPHIDATWGTRQSR
jgi:hypothetical protein